MYISGVVISKSEFQSSGRGTFSGKGEYEFAFHFWYCEPFVKNQWGEAEDLILLLL